jgi:hypothetical protein
VTGSSARHGQRSGRISLVQAGQARRGGWPDSVLRENTLTRMRGPAIKPAVAAARIQGSVTVSARLDVGLLGCARTSAPRPTAYPACCS